MNKLLSANFARLWKDRTFRFVAVIVFLSSIATIFNVGHTVSSQIASGFPVAPDDYFFNHAPMMGMYFAVFCSLFLGTEYSDGTMRNKLIVGHSRRDVYLATYLTCFASGIVFLIIWWVASVPGIFMTGRLEMGIDGFARYALIAIGFMAAFASIFTAVGTLSMNKALTVVFSLMIWLVFLLTASGCYDRLCEPEMNGGMMFTAQGLQAMEPEPNPSYVSGVMRTILECLMDFLPTGQAMLMADNAIVHPVRQMIFSSIFSVSVILIGSYLFQKKDIK